MTTPQEDFTAWLSRHYDALYGEHDGPDFRCTRCGKQTNYPTKHAAIRHGDKITVMPVKNTRIELIY